MRLFLLGIFDLQDLCKNSYVKEWEEINETSRRNLGTTKVGKVLRTRDVWMLLRGLPTVPVSSSHKVQYISKYGFHVDLYEKAWHIPCKSWSNLWSTHLDSMGVDNFLAHDCGIYGFVIKYSTISSGELECVSSSAKFYRDLDQNSSVSVVGEFIMTVRANDF